jgi:tRNA(Ile)-lysidine synthase
VTFSTAILASRFKELEAVAAKPKRYVIAFSGGLDSTVLAHALANLKHHDDYSGIPVLAVHIDHGLQAESADWAFRCRDAAAEFEIDFRSLVVNVQTESGKGPEASARDARYSALHAEIGTGDWLLSAHHREDQAETLLLNLIRGSGPAGVAGIGSLRRFGPGWLVRPLLNVDRADLQQYALDESLLWVDDPSNSNRRFDRNFLRHEVLPRLKSRWPDIATRLQRSAGHAGEASQLLVELAEIDVQALGGDTARLPIDALSALSAARQRNVIRYAIRDRGFSTPTALQLERIMKEVIRARVDAQPLVSWPGASVRRYRNGLYLLPQNLADQVECRELEGTELELGSGLGVLRFESGDDIGLSKALLDGGLTIKPRVGGERFSPYGQTHTRELKKLLQEEGVVPWMRDRLPLVYSGDRLLAVGDLWLAADAVTKPGVAIRWSDRPALH